MQEKRVIMIVEMTCPGLTETRLGNGSNSCNAHEREKTTRLQSFYDHGTPGFARSESNREQKRRCRGAMEEKRGCVTDEWNEGWADLLRNLPILNSVLASPFASRRLVPGAVCLVDMRDLGHQRVVGVGVCEHGADREQHWRWSVKLV